MKNQDTNQTHNTDTLRALGRNLGKVQSARGHLKLQIMEKYKLGPFSLRMLKKLEQEDQPLSELKKSHSKRSASADQHRGRGHGRRHGHGRKAFALVKLSERGLINIVDGTVSLTDDGKKLLSDIREDRQNFRNELTAGVSEQDWNTTLATLNTLAENLPESEHGAAHWRKRRSFRSNRGFGRAAGMVRGTGFHGRRHHRGAHGMHGFHGQHCAG